MRRKIEQFLRWAQDVEWAMVASAMATFILFIPELLTELEVGLEASEGTEMGFRSAVVLFLGVMIRSKVWSKATVIEIAGDDHAEAHVTESELAGIKSEQYQGVQAGDKKKIKDIPGV